MTDRSLHLLLTIGILSLFLTGVGAALSSENVSNQTPVPIGILVMKSGFVADIGTEYTRAFDMVMQDNPNSLIKPEIIDGGSERAVASENWKNMQNRTPDLPVVVTVASWTSNIVYPDAARLGMIQVALGSAAVNRSLQADYLVKFTPGVVQESPVLASYLERFDRIAVVRGVNDYSSEFSKALVSLLKEKIVLESRYDQNNISATLNITDILLSDPDVVVLLSVSEGGEVAELLRNGGISAPFVGTRVIGRNTLTEIKAADGLIFTTPELNSSHPFFTRYREKYGENATFYGAEGYDALITLNSAISECGDDRECMYTWYQNQSYDGALGSVSFDDRGIATYPIGFMIVSGEKFEEYRI